MEAELGACKLLGEEELRGVRGVAPLRLLGVATRAPCLEPCSRNMAVCLRVMTRVDLHSCVPSQVASGFPSLEYLLRHFSMTNELADLLRPTITPKRILRIQNHRCDEMTQIEAPLRRFSEAAWFHE